MQEIRRRIRVIELANAWITQIQIEGRKKKIEGRKIHAKH